MQEITQFTGYQESEPSLKKYSELSMQEFNFRRKESQYPELHSSCLTHDPETCVHCRKATKYLLDLSNCEEIKFIPSQSRIEEFKLFGNSDVMLFGEKSLETWNGGFKFARSSKRFSKESYWESRDESWTNNFKQFEKEMASFKEKQQAEKKLYALKEFKPNNVDKPMFTPKTDLKTNNGHKPWKPVISIDPALSPRYNQVFPALERKQQQQQQQQIVHYNNASTCPNPQPTWCVFCRNNSEPPEVFLSHKIKDVDGRITCPVLRKYKCEYCEATGDFAHTKSHCPKKALMLMQHQMQSLIYQQQYHCYVYWPFY